MFQHSSTIDRCFKTLKSAALISVIFGEGASSLVSRPFEPRHAFSAFQSVSLNSRFKRQSLLSWRQPICRKRQPGFTMSRDSAQARLLESFPTSEERNYRNDERPGVVGPGVGGEEPISITWFLHALQFAVWNPQTMGLLFLSNLAVILCGRF